MVYAKAKPQTCIEIRFLFTFSAQVSYIYLFYLKLIVFPECKNTWANVCWCFRWFCTTYCPSGQTRKRVNQTIDKIEAVWCSFYRFVGCSVQTRCAWLLWQWFNTGASTEVKAKKTILSDGFPGLFIMSERKGWGRKRSSQNLPPLCSVGVCWQKLSHSKKKTQRKTQTVHSFLAVWNETGFLFWFLILRKKINNKCVIPVHKNLINCRRKQFLDNFLLLSLCLAFLFFFFFIPSRPFG